MNFPRNESAVHEGESAYLSKGVANHSEMSGNQNQTHYNSKRHHSLSATTAILVIVVSIGFMLMALYLLWRKYQFSSRYFFLFCYFPAVSLILRIDSILGNTIDYFQIVLNPKV